MTTPNNDLRTLAREFRLALEARLTDASMWEYRLPSKDEVAAFCRSYLDALFPLYYAKERETVVRNGSLVLIHDRDELLPGEESKRVKCRMRSLGCVPCTGAIRSEADTLPKIVEEMISFRRSERENRAIDHDEEGSMELKKREGYF